MIQAQAVAVVFGGERQGGDWPSCAGPPNRKRPVQAATWIRATSKLKDFKFYSNRWTRSTRQRAVMIEDSTNQELANIWFGDRTELASDEAKSVSDKEALAFVMSRNLHRRHLTESQRAMVAAELVTMQRGGDRKSDDFNTPRGVLNSIGEASADLNVSPSSIDRARQVRDSGDQDLLTWREQRNGSDTGMAA